MNPRYLSKVQAAVESAARVFAYSASSYLVGTIGVSAFSGGGQTPDLETLKGWGLGALFSGGAALVSFVKNMTKPKSQVIQ